MKLAGPLLFACLAAYGPALAGDAQTDFILNQSRQRLEAQMIDKPTQIAVSPAMRHAARRAIDSGLRDPGTARWGSDAGYAAQDPSQAHYCGSLSAKNGFGGYTGLEPVWALLSRESGHWTVIQTDVSDPGDEGQFFRDHPVCDPKHWR